MQRSVGLGVLVVYLLSSVACTGSDEETEQPGPVVRGGSSGSGSGGSGGGGSGGRGGSGGARWMAAVGEKGAFLQTFDEATWEERAVAEDDLDAVSCVGNVVGWAVGRRGTLLHTSYSGSLWAALDAGTDADLHAVAFAKSEAAGYVGVLAGEGGVLRVSHDGGLGWAALPNAPATLRGAAISQDAFRVVVVGDAATVLVSEDSGHSFQRGSIGAAVDLTDVALDASGLFGVAVDAAGGVWESLDGGRSFERAHVAPAALRAVSIGDTGSFALVAGDGGLALLRDALGAWREPETGTTAGLSAALVTHDEHALYLGGEDGTLLVSRDGGSHFARVELETTTDLLDLEDLDPQ